MWEKWYPDEERDFTEMSLVPSSRVSWPLPFSPEQEMLLYHYKAGEAAVFVLFPGKDK